jgi:hypothetical protein
MKPPRAFCWKASLAVAAALCPRAALAWSANGHAAIGQIAQDLLTQSAKNGDASSQAALDAMKAIMTSDPADSGFVWSDNALAAVAPCADSMRPEPASATSPGVKPGDPVTCDRGLLHFIAAPTGAWHFVDTSILAPATADTIASACAGSCVVTAIADSAATLAKGDAPMSDKKIALANLVHFVGDEHQPMHCATQYRDGAHTAPNDPSDRGGNFKQVKFGDATLNLHSLWDHQIQASDGGNDPAALSRKLEAQLPADTSGWTAPGFVAEAARESFEVAQGAIYKPFDQYPKATMLVNKKPTTVSILPDDYQSQMQPIVYDRIEKAGVRLAALLKQALGSGASSLERAQERVKAAESAPPP